MSVHPNAILMATLTPSGVAGKTFREILAENRAVGDRIFIGDKEYMTCFLMSGDYDQYLQIVAREGDLVFFDFVTYGYYDTISWSDLIKQESALERWAKETCKKHDCSYRIAITANYW